MLLQLFKQAKLQRDPKLANQSYVEIMSTAAAEAGHHLVYVENLQNANKWQVRYKKPFSSAVTSELLIRMEGFILGFLANRDFDPFTIESHICYSIFNFIKTYKPDVHTTDQAIIGALHSSIKQKIEQSNRKETFKYRPGYKGYSKEDRKKMEEDPEYKGKERYVKTPKEISLNFKVEGKDSDDDSTELADYISDPVDSFKEKEETMDLELEFATDINKKAFLKILIECGSSGKVSIKDFGRSALTDPEIVNETRIEISKKKGLDPEEVDFELVVNRVMKKAKVFYRNIKEEILATRSPEILKKYKSNK